jgi:hypothetical protein
VTGDGERAGGHVVERVYQELCVLVGKEAAGGHVIDECVDRDTVVADEVAQGGAERGGGLGMVDRFRGR